MCLSGGTLQRVRALHALHALHAMRVRLVRCACDARVLVLDCMLPHTYATYIYSIELVTYHVGVVVWRILVLAGTVAQTQQVCIYEYAYTCE